MCVVVGIIDGVIDGKIVGVRDGTCIGPGVGAELGDVLGDALGGVLGIYHLEHELVQPLEQMLMLDLENLKERLLVQVLAHQY